MAEDRASGSVGSQRCGVRVSVIRVLVTARDMGTAAHLVPLIKELRRRPEFVVLLVASDAAAAHFSCENVDFEPIANSPPYVATPPLDVVAALHAEARHLIDEFQPDIALSGVSNYAGGIDDAVQSAARAGRYAPITVIMTDTQGPLKRGDSGDPDHVLATTQQSLEWVARNSKAMAHLIGAPKYVAFQGLNIDAMRREYRSSLGLRSHERLCLFIAQGGDVPGHNEGFFALARALAGRKDGSTLRLAIRAHPSFPDTARHYEAFANDLGLSPLMDYQRNLVEALSAADGVATCTSTVTQDYLWLAHNDPRLRAVLVHLLVDERLRRYLAEFRHGWIPYAAEVGAAALAKNEAELPHLLDAMAGDAPPPTTKPWQPDVSDPIARTIEILKTIVRPTKRVSAQG
jgi:hypothetical protein